ncbi:MAG: type II secretion system protein [Candidatus Methylacidiphilales bacterium]
MKRNSGFTLIELLVVITIIGILAGLSFPAISGAINAAKKAEAGAMVSQIKIALTSYQTEYGRWPSMLAGATDQQIESDNAPFYELLIGRNDTTDNNNPRRIVFMEFNSKALRADATSKTPPADLSTANRFVDPWNQAYFIRVDSNYDNVITVPGGDINASIAVWSTGKPNGAARETTVSKFVKSW